LETRRKRLQNHVCTYPFRIPPRRPGFNPGSGQVGFVVDKVASGQVFSEYFGFPCHSFPNFSILTITRGRYNRPVSGRRAEWTQFGLHPPLCKFKKKKLPV
jgi:hypothetical protein